MYYCSGLLRISDNTVFTPTLTWPNKMLPLSTMTSPIGTPLCIFHPNPDWNRGLPGIDFDHQGCAAPLFAGAPREYADNEGWQTVKRRGGAKRFKSQSQSKKRKAEVVAAIAAADDN